jgi:hypothetical protein
MSLPPVSGAVATRRGHANISTTLNTYSDVTPTMQDAGGRATMVAQLGGRHTIRINDQWRICFRWTAAGPEEIEITDYH